MKLLKTFLKVVGILVLVILTFAIIFSGTYVYKHYPRKIDSFEVNKPILNNKILVVSEGSDFKNTLLETIVTKIENDSTYIKIIHTSDINSIESNEWDRIVIINTCVANKLGKHVNLFLANHTNDVPTIMVITAGDGSWQPANLNVDAISTASRLSRMEAVTDSVINYLN